MAQERARERHRRILEAALQVYARRGYGAATMDEVARASRTSKGGLYFHFPSKEELFLALLRYAGQRLLEKAQEAMAAAPDPVSRADVALSTVLRTFSRHRALARILLLEGYGAGRRFQAEVTALRGRCAALVRGCLEEAMAQRLIGPLDAELTARAWFGAVAEVIVHWLLTGQPRRLEDAYPHLRALFLRSVGLPPGGVDHHPSP
jgi:AcrR family transcriptional regulator